MEIFVRSENRLMVQARGEHAGAPLLEKDRVRSEMIPVLEQLTGQEVGTDRLESPEIQIRTSDEAEGYHVVLFASQGLYPQAGVIVRSEGQHVASIDLSNNPTEIPREDADAVREILTSLNTVLSITS